jgi:hypothetical protein
MNGSAQLKAQIHSCQRPPVSLKKPPRLLYHYTHPGYVLQILQLLRVPTSSINLEFVRFDGYLALNFSRLETQSDSQSTEYEKSAEHSWER